LLDTLQLREVRGVDFDQMIEALPDAPLRIGRLPVELIAIQCSEPPARVFGHGARFGNQRGKFLLHGVHKRTLE
jgi:hypothetical protein